MDKRAHLRRAGVLFLEARIKEGQWDNAHPIEQMRQGARYNTGLTDLRSEMGIDPDAHLSALANNEEYYNRLRGLYDKHMAPQKPTLSESVAAQKQPVNISAENVPKVVSAPK